MARRLSLLLPDPEHLTIMASRRPKGADITTRPLVQQTIRPARKTGLQARGTMLRDRKTTLLDRKTTLIAPARHSTRTNFRRRLVRLRQIQGTTSWTRNTTRNSK